MDYKTSTIISARSFSQGRGLSSVSPVHDMSIPEVFDYLLEHPNDGFMISHLDDLMNDKTDDVMAEAIKRFRQEPNIISFGAMVLTPKNKYPEAYKALAETKNPAILLEFFDNHHSMEVRDIKFNDYVLVQRLWDRIFCENRENHRTFSETNKFMLAIPKNFFESLANPRQYTHIRDVVLPELAQDIKTGTSLRQITLQQTLEKIDSLPLEDILDGDTFMGAGFCGTYMTMIDWKLNLNIPFGRNVYKMSGVSQSSGKGMDHDSATASGFMEALERYSAGLGCTVDFPGGFRQQQSLHKASYAQLAKEGILSLNPNTLSLRIPYEGHELNWIKGETIGQDGKHEILVPAQAVYLFSNLDEISFSVASSNGLASGNTIDEAKLHALFEIVERDGDYTMFYSPEKVFKLTADDPKIGEILDRYQKRGLTIQVLDLTSEFGVPTYRAFVQADGQILSGSGTHLDGRIAAARAICELSPKCLVWEKRHGGWRDIQGPSDGTQSMSYDKLPSYSSGNVEADLAAMENLLLRNGYAPIYVDLTRSDIQIPVVRAIVPGLDMPAGPSERQIAHFLDQSGMKEQVLQQIANAK